MPICSEESLQFHLENMGDSCMLKNAPWSRSQATELRLEIDFSGNIENLVKLMKTNLTFVEAPLYQQWSTYHSLCL